MILAPIVEGHGDAQAVPILLRRLLERIGFYSLRVAPPVRIPRDQMVREKELSRAIKLASLRVEDFGAVIIVLDSDDACPVELAQSVSSAGEAAGAACPVVVISAQREYESIFLAAADSLAEVGLTKTGTPTIENPETIRGAKERIRSILIDGRYRETQEQARLTARIDLDEALRLRWLRKLDKELRLIVNSFPTV
ncbi:DUF4276 family protein [Nocardia beijingensis]|uniref:DUF4276 family protein n=1 Tax=Nocardia beijingensis TaxID=95162 RepID=UPI0009FD4DCB|nr:DUF4276 family protein [Nocardia beijingensis]